MRLVETLALTVLGIVTLIVVLQRADSTRTVFDGIAGLTERTVGSLTGAPR